MTGLTSVLATLEVLVVMFKMNGLITIVVAFSFAIALGASASFNLNVTRYIMIAEIIILAWYGRLTLGQIQGFIHYVKKLSNPFEPRRLNSLWTAISSARHTFGLLDEL